MNIGSYLQQARERAGLSREQIAQHTKIQLAKVEALEANAFERLPDGIYLDGILRAYARQVSLDPEDVVQRARAELAASGQDEAATDHIGHTGTTIPPVADANLHPESDRFHDVDADAEPDLTLTHLAATSAAADVERQNERVLVPPHVAPPPRRRGDLVRFGLPLLALVAAAGWGAYLYESSRPYYDPADVDVPVISNPELADNAAAADDDPSTAPGRNSSDAPDAAVATRGQSRVTRDTDDARAAGAARAESPQPTANRRDTADPPAAASRDRDATPRAGGDVSPLDGVWTLATRVETSSYRNFEGLELGYRLQLRRDGDRVTGSGVKIMENGRRLASGAQTPIEVRGTIAGERLTLTFTERGAKRASEGRMVLERHDDGAWRGRFSSSAARSSGLVEARRPEA